jgi:hypothetical protein
MPFLIPCSVLEVARIVEELKALNRTQQSFSGTSSAPEPGTSKYLQVDEIRLLELQWLSGLSISGASGRFFVGRSPCKVVLGKNPAFLW